MPSTIVKKKLNLFSILSQQDDGSWQKIAVRGTGFTYDADGELVGGTVSSIQKSFLTGAMSRSLETTSSETRFGFEIASATVANLTTGPIWNSLAGVTNLLANFSLLQTPALLNVINAASATFTGTDLSNRITGGTRGEQINGLGGDDILQGRNGDDTINGGAGNDRLLGGNGNDTLTDTAGLNGLSGAAGNDRMTGGAGADAFDGGLGNDVITTGGGIDKAVGGAGADTFIFSIDANPSSLTIRDFNLTEDHIVFADRSTALAAFTEFKSHAKQVGLSVVYEHLDDKIVLLETNLAGLTESQFLGAI